MCPDGAPALANAPKWFGGELNAADESDVRARAAWCAWLSALATDAEAAAAAALTYESLPVEARRAWLDALEVDAPELNVHPVALYAPLLAVEVDDALRARMHQAIQVAANTSADICGPAALRARLRDGYHAAIIRTPLYLDFVQVLVCIFDPDAGVRFAKHDPLRHRSDWLQVEELEGIALLPAPLADVVEDLAHAIVADTRKGRPLPPALTAMIHLFETKTNADDAQSQDQPNPASHDPTERTR